MAETNIVPEAPIAPTPVPTVAPKATPAPVQKDTSTPKKESLKEVVQEMLNTYDGMMPGASANGFLNKFISRLKQAI